MDVAKYINENYPDEPLIVADGFDEAFIGVGYSFNAAYACYDTGKVIEIMMRDGLSYEEAVEHFYFNVLGSYVGENTPVFIDKVTE